MLDKSRAGEIAKEFGATVYSSIEEMLQWGKIQAASIAVPTVTHLKAAQPLLEGRRRCSHREAAGSESV